MIVSTSVCTESQPAEFMYILSYDPDEYTIEDTDEFDGFQVKISLLGRNQPYIPRVKDFRAIALA